jgi:hypothetical protein
MPSIPLLLDALAESLSVEEYTSDRLHGITPRLQAYRTSQLIVLDNLETVWDPPESHRQSERLLASFCDIPNTTLLLTMRGTVRPSSVSWDPL